MAKLNKSILIALVVLAVAVFIVCYLQGVFAPLLLGLLVAYILNPWINFLERKGVRRVVGITFTFSLLILAVFLVFLLVIPVMYAEIARFYDAAFFGDEFIDSNRDGKFSAGEPLLKDANQNGAYDPSYFEKARSFTAGLIAKWNSSYPAQQIELDRVVEDIRKSLYDNKEFVIGQGVDVVAWVLKQFGYGFKGLMWLVSYVILVPVYIFFFLLYMNRMWEWFVGYLPAEKKDFILAILGRIDRMMANFFRGKATICALKAVLTLAGLYIFGIKFALVFALIQLFASLIPYLVLIVGMAPALLVAVLEYGLDWRALLSVIGVFCVVELLEGFLLTPFIMRKEIGLHPLVVIVALLIGGSLLGFLGLLLAIPAAAIIKILWQDWIGPTLRGQPSAGES